ncbi:MAG: CtsR family transcriptional regulator [Peptococcaceae bacterium]
MSSISRKIESYLKAMLENAHNGVIEIQRSSLSNIFECVPSQINYVLGTRFTPAHGYIVETRRGGGGYVRIIRLNFNNNKSKNLLDKIIGAEISQNEALGLLENLRREGLLTSRETLIIRNIVTESVLAPSFTNNPEGLRAQILQGLIATIMREDI